VYLLKGSLSDKTSNVVSNLSHCVFQIQTNCKVAGRQNFSVILQCSDACPELQLTFSNVYHVFFDVNAQWTTFRLANQLKRVSGQGGMGGSVLLLVVVKHLGDHILWTSVIDVVSLKENFSLWCEHLVVANSYLYMVLRMYKCVCQSPLFSNVTSSAYNWSLVIQNDDTITIWVISSNQGNKHEYYLRTM